MKCKKCGEEKTVTQMAKFAGKPTETCKDCRWGRGPAKSPADEPPPTAARDLAPPAPRVPQITEVSVAASLGFTARIDDDSLVISQANASRENDDDNITLTRAEAKRLFDTFGEWIVGAA